MATYKGQPTWHQLADVRSRTPDAEPPTITDEALSSIGFLTLTGKEKLFALDGQHRLAGIKEVVARGLAQELGDEVSVILVGHEDSAEGIRRSRRLFTTLNKTARPVSKGEIIALDEDDVMAICVRRLIEETDLFTGPRVAFVATNNIPVGDDVCLTTIGNLYDILTILFTSSRSDLKRRRPALQRARPSDDELQAYFEYAKLYFDLLRSTFQELADFFGAEDTRPVVREFRGRASGSALFRPIGLEVFTRLICRLTDKRSLGEAVELAGHLPRQLAEPPYEHLMWDPHNKTILSGHRVTLREVLLYMVRCASLRYSTEELLDRYRTETGLSKRGLPARVV